MLHEDEEPLFRCRDSDDESDDVRPAPRRFAARAQRFTPHFREQIDEKQTTFRYCATASPKPATPLADDVDNRCERADANVNANANANANATATANSIATTTASSAISVVVALEYRLNGTGSSLWDSSIVLLKYLEKQDIDWRSQRVLDLGAGSFRRGPCVESTLLRVTASLQASASLVSCWLSSARASC